MTHLVCIWSPFESAVPINQQGPRSHPTPVSALVKKVSSHDDTTHADPLSVFLLQESG